MWISESVKSATTTVSILVDHEMMTPLYIAQCDCMDLQLGNILPKDESEKNTGCVGRLYGSDCFFENIYWIR